MIKRLFNWIFGMQSKQDVQTIEEYLAIEHRKKPKRTQ